MDELFWDLTKQHTCSRGAASIAQHCRAPELWAEPGAGREIIMCPENILSFSEVLFSLHSPVGMQERTPAGWDAGGRAAKRQIELGYKGWG